MKLKWITLSVFALHSVYAQDFSSGDTNAVSGDPGETASGAQQLTMDPATQQPIADPNAVATAQDPNAQFVDPNQLAAQDPNAQFVDPNAQPGVAAADPNQLAADPNNLTGVQQPSLTGGAQMPVAAQMPSAAVQPQAVPQPAAGVPAVAGTVPVAGAANGGAVPILPPPLPGAATGATTGAASGSPSAPASSCSINCFKDSRKAAGKSSVDAASMCEEPFVSTFDKCTETNGCTDAKELKKTLVAECTAQGKTVKLSVADPATPTVDGAGSFGTGSSLSNSTGPSDTDQAVTERKSKKGNSASSLSSSWVTAMAIGLSLTLLW